MECYGDLQGGILREKAQKGVCWIGGFLTQGYCQSRDLGMKDELSCRFEMSCAETGGGCSPLCLLTFSARTDWMSLTWRYVKMFQKRLCCIKNPHALIDLQI